MCESNHADYIVTHATLITQNKTRDVIEDGMLVVCDGKFVYVGKHDPDILRWHGIHIDCGGRIVLPGLIDGHGHAGHPMTKHISADALPFWGRSVRKIYFFYTTPEFWYYDGLLSAMERLCFGVTTGMNVIANEPRVDSIEFAQNHIRAYCEVGARTVVGVGPGSNNWPKPLARLQEGKLVRTTATWEEYIRNTELLLQTAHGSHQGKVRVFVTPYTIVPSIPTWGRVPPERANILTEFDRRQMKAVRELAKKYHTGIHSDAFGNGIEMMCQCEDALVGENVLLQHCYDLNYRELQLLAQTKTNVGHSAEQSHHFCPFSEMNALGINTIITSDGNGPRVNFDMFEHMRRCQDLEMMRFGDFNCIDAQQLLDRVTIRAAQALGMADVVGSLEKGKEADFIILGNEHLPEDCSSPLERCVYEVAGRDCQDVFVRGQWCVQNGRLTTIEQDKVLREANRVAWEVFQNADVLRYVQQAPVFGNPYQTYVGQDIGEL